MLSSRAFSRCTVCTHAAMTRVGAPCGLCGGSMGPATPPPDLLDGWRCACYGCAATPC